MAFAVLSALAAGASHAGSLAFCARTLPVSAGHEDTLLRFAGIVKGELERSGARVALVARSGLDLARFGMRYSHSGVSLRESPNAPWSVRQLYYACDEGRPRIFDEGLSGFVMGSDDAATGYLSVLLLPAAPADALEHAALDNARALRLLGAGYSANAWPFSTRYQNCNQWVMELLAQAWGAPDDPAAPRAAAQQWLRDQGYVPSAMQVGWRAVMWLGALIPYVHNDDHPEADFEARAYAVSMPASIEAFARAQAPGATRIEFCHAGRRVVIHRGWEPVAEGCVPGADDTVIALD